MADNQDIAVLGFTVQTKNAETALGNIETALSNLDAHIAITDAALESKVTKSLKDLANSLKGFNNPAYAKGLADTVAALQSLSELGGKFDNFAAGSKAISDAVSFLNGLDFKGIINGYADSFKNANHELSSFKDEILKITGHIGTVMNMKDVSAQSEKFDVLVKLLNQYYDTISKYSGETPQLKLPNGVMPQDIDAMKGQIANLRDFAEQYNRIITGTLQVSGKTRYEMQSYNPEAELAKNEEALAKASKNIQGAIEEIQKSAGKLVPEGMTTLRFNAEIANLDIIKRQLKAGMMIDLNVKDMDKFNQAKAVMEALTKPIEINYDQEKVQSLVSMLNKITPKFDVSETSVKLLQSQLDDISQRLSVEVKIVPRVSGDDEAIAALQKKNADAARDALKAMGIDVHGQKTIEDAIKGDFYGLVNLGRDLEQLYGGKNVNSIMAALFPKQGAGTAEMFREFTESLGGIRREMESLLAFKATLDTSEFDAAMSKFQQTLTNVFTEDSKKKFTNQLAEDLKKTAIVPESITIAPQKIFVDRSDSVMKFVQNTLVMPVDDIHVTPQTIWVDKSQSELRLLQAQFVADFPDVIVHPENILVDTVSVPQEKITMLGGSKNTFDVHAGTVRIAPTSLKLDPAAMADVDVQAWTKTVKVAANVLIKPSSLKVEQSALNNAVVALDKPIRIKTYMTAMEEIKGVYEGMVPIAQQLAVAMKDINDSLSSENIGKIKSATDIAKILDFINKGEKEEAKAKKAEEEATKGMKEAYDRMNDTSWQKGAAERVENIKQIVEGLHDTEYQQTQVGGKIFNAWEDDNKKAVASTKERVDAAKDASKTFIDNAKKEAEAMRVASQTMRNRLMAIADDNKHMALHGVTIRDVNMQMREFGRVQKLNIEDPLKRLKADLGETNSRLIDLGRTFGLYLSGRSIINYFRQASESANTFQYEIRRIQSLATNFDFGELRNGLMDIDARFGNVVHNASALYWAFSSGVRGSEKDLVKFTETMSKTATTIKADVMPTLDAATSIMNAWNLNASSAAEIGDLLFGIVKYGKSNAQQLTTSLGHVVAPAAALNIELDELGAAAATLTKTMKTNRAFTYLSNILGKMASPTKAVQEAAAELGIELSASSIKARGFANTLADIRQATGGDIAKIAKIFPDLRGQRAAITLLSTQYKDFEQQLVNMRNKAGSMEEALSKIADTPEAQLRALKNTFSMLSIEAGNTVNSMLTLGGALGPVLKSINELGHTGRATLGNVIATGAAWAGMAVTMKAVQASQYAIAQMAYQQSSAAADLYKTELDTSLLKERQALENNKIALSEMKAKIAADEYNDATLRELKAKQETLKVSLRQGDADLRNARQALKIANESDRRRFLADSAALGETQGKLGQYRKLLMEEQTGDAAKNYRRDLNMVERVRSDVKMLTADLQTKESQWMTSSYEGIRSMVEQSGKVQAALKEAMAKGNLGDYQHWDKVYSEIVQTIKASTVVNNELTQFDNAEKMVEAQAKKYALAKLESTLTSGDNQQHKMRLEILNDEIKKVTDEYNTAKAQYAATRDQLGLDTERQQQADQLLQIETNLNKLKTEQADLVTQIEQRTENLTGREKEQAAILAENIKNMKAWLDADTTDSQTLKSNLELALKNAATLGKDTLAATRAAYEAEMRRNSILMQQRAVMSEILSITDKNGNLLDKSEKSQEHLNKLLAEQAKLMKDSADARRQFITLGAHAGNQDAVKTIIDQYQRTSKAGFLNPSLQKKYLGVVVDRLKLDSGVQSEMIRAMVREMGGRGMAGFFSGNAMRSMTMAMSFIPGMQRWAMPLNLMSSFNVIGQAQKGFAGLSSSMTRMLVSAENLKKKGFMALDKNMVDLTKTFIENVAWTKKQAFANKALMAMSTGSVAGKNAIAGAAVTSTWLTAGLGGAIIAAVASGLYLAFSKTEKGGPFGEIAEKLFGVDDKQRYGEYLNLRIEMMNTERTANDDMIREMKRMIAATSNIQDSLLNIAERNRMIEAMQGIERYGNVSQTKLDIVEVQHQIENDQKRLEALQNSVSRGGLRGAPISKNSYDAQRIQQLQQEIEQATKDLQEKQKIVKEYPKFLASLAEADYQLLRETMEADRDSAFMPMKDAQARFQLAEKQVKLSLNRLASILGPKGGIADLANATTADVQEMARTVIKDLYEKKKRAEDNLNAAKLKLELAKQQKQNTTELEKKVTDLEKQAADATKAYENTRQNIQTGARDLYANLVNRAEMYVKSQLDLVKRRESNAKYLALFENVDTSFRTQAENITIMRQTMDKLQKDFASGSGIFKGLSPKDRDDTYRDKVLEVSEATKTMISNRANAIKTMADQMNTFMNSLASDMESQAKSLFDFKINNPLYAEMRPTLIKNRMGFLNQLLYGKGGVLSMRANALAEMKRLQDLGDLGNAQKMLMEAQKWQKKGVDIEQQRLDLIKLEADKEKEINASLYQLANTLRGQFQATSQQAIDADSAEAIRLRSRAFNENIAPAVSTDANRLLAQEWERMAARNEEWSNELKKSVDSLTEALIKEADDKAINGAAVNIKTAGDNIKAAAGIFQKAAEQTKTMIVVKRI